MSDRIEVERPGSIVWHPILLALRGEVITFYWSPTRATVRESCDFFYARLRKEEQELSPWEVEMLMKPSMRTLRRWIQSAETFETFSARYGRRIARLRYGAGRDPAAALSTTKPQ